MHPSEPEITGGDETLAAGGGTSVGAGAPSSAAGLQRGDTVGRYIIVTRLGAGGMGTVWSAYDPDLDRRVAIKMLHADADGSIGHTRLLREAQALAKLNDPHVVAVHDVGVLDDRVWIAMELVEGETFGTWLHARDRSSAELVRVLLAATAGLAAAHRVGLVHRDIKPDNVMIDGRGRVRVMDFGLARRSRDEDAPSSEHELTTSALSLEVTRGGAVLGTPAYMSPEQHAGAPADARSDVFSLCVMAWEAVYGERPFAGDTMVALAAAVVSGDRRRPQQRANAPGWLLPILDRGLQIDPQARWASAEGILDAVSEHRRAARRRRLGGGLVAVGVVVATIAGLQAMQDRRADAACVSAGDVVRDDWPGRREAVRATFGASRSPLAAPTLERVEPRLDAWAQAWADARTDVCRRAETGELPPQLRRRAVACLEDRRVAMAELVRRLETGGMPAIRSAVTAVMSSSRLETCTDRAHLERGVWPEDDQWEEVARLRGIIARAKATEHAGGDPVPQLEDALAGAETLGWVPLVASVQVRLANAIAKDGDYPASESLLRTAYFAAAKAGDDETAGWAAATLVNTYGRYLARREVALEWADQAEMMLSRAGEDDPASDTRRILQSSRALLRRDAGDLEGAAAILGPLVDVLEQRLGREHPNTLFIASSYATVLFDQGKVEPAIELLGEVVAASEALLGPDHPQTTSLRSNLASAVGAAGDPARAEVLMLEIIAARERVEGPDHPDLISALTNLGYILNLQGRAAETLPLYERAHRIAVASLGPDHPQTLDALLSIAGALQRLERLDEAAALFEQGLQAQRRALGEDHVEVGMTLHNFGELRMSQGRYDEARELVDAGLRIARARFGDDHIRVGFGVAGLGAIAVAQGDAPAAEPQLREGVAILERVYGPDHPEVAMVRGYLAKSLLALERFDEAVATLQHVVRVRDAVSAAPGQRAEVREDLARAHWGALAYGEARSSAQEAIDLYREAGDEVGAARVEAWRAEHSRP